METISVSEIDPHHPNESLQHERAIFTTAFQNSYTNLPGKALNLPSGTTLGSFLADAFAEEDKVWNKTACTNDMPPPHRFYRAEAVVGGKRIGVGFMSVDVLCGGREVYVRQLAVNPEFQRKGVGRRLIREILSEQVMIARVCYRKGNMAACGLYERVGFVSVRDTHGLDPEVYNGMVWNREQHK